MIKKVVSDKEKAKVLDHMVNSITGESRRLRFCYQASDESVQKYVEGSFKNLGWDNAWFIQEDKDGRVIASCHVAFDKKNLSAEIGFVVHPDARGQGIGQKMFARGVTWGRARGANELYMQCLAENKIVQHIAAKNGMRQVTVGGDKEATLGLTSKCRITAAMSDAVDDAIGLYCKAIRRHTRRIENIFA